jgi:hypothetical protein
LLRDAAPLSRIFNYFYGKIVIWACSLIKLKQSIFLGIIKQYERMAVTMEVQNPNTKTLLRAIYIIGLLCQNFNFDRDYLRHEGKSSLIRHIYLLYFC